MTTVPSTGDTTVHLRTCPLCECMCGLQVHVDGEQHVTLIRPDRDDVWSKGFICPKGTTLGKLHEDPDRIRTPMIREGDVWREASWDEAFERCEELISGVLDDHGLEGFTQFIGNPAGHSYTFARYAGLMRTMAPMRQTFSAGTVDQWPKNVVCVLMYGNMWKIPAPDVHRTDYWICMGGNPQASGGSLLACPDVLGEIDKIRERGGKVVVIDPRRTGTADRADEWLPIVPGTDAAFLLAMANVLFAEGLTTLGALADKVKGDDDVRALCAPYTPESVESFCKVPAETIRRIAREFAAAPTGALYGRIGLCNQEFGTLASWMVEVVNIITGKFDRPGGLMWGTPIGTPMHWMASTKVNGPQQFGTWKSRVSGVPEVLGQVPCALMAEEIATPGEGQIHGLISFAANPVLSVPDSAKLEAALPLLDCMIAIDIYLNETTRHAHVILPGPSALESPHFDDLLWGWAMRSAAKFSDPVFELPDGTPDEGEIITHLAWLCAGNTNATFDFQALDDQWFTGLCGALGVDPEAAMSHAPSGGTERIIDLAVRTGPFGDRYGENPDGLNLEKVKAEAHGIDLGPMVPSADRMVTTPDDMIDLAPTYITDDLPRLDAKLAEHTDGLVLVSRRHIRSKNSWMHNVKVLVKGKDRCTLLVNPDDATRYGLADGGRARVSSEAGSIEVPVEVTDEMMSGVVCLPHGWGHDKPGTKLSVAREHAGVNNNLLAPSHFVDKISNNHAVNGIPVEVVPA